MRNGWNDILLLNGRLIGLDHSYRTTLNTKSTIDDEEEQDQMLKACHKRCAERTLKVLEKNGGIFIKLGQHLVSATISILSNDISMTKMWLT